MSDFTAPTCSGPSSTIAFAADALRRFPGERLVLFLQVRVRPPYSVFQVLIFLTKGLRFLSCEKQGLPGLVDARFRMEDGAVELVWDIQKEPTADVCCKFQVAALVEPTFIDHALDCSAALIIQEEGQQLRWQQDITISVKAKSAYLKYLPSIYQAEDELMGRFLMLFESFLAPIDQQITHLSEYFDARLTPVEFLPWLASWVGMGLGSELSEKQSRDLLANAVSLYQRRGTRWQMRKYLEMITGGAVSIVDVPGVILNSEALLGLDPSLGKSILPNHFLVTVRMPPFPKSLGKEERAQQKEILERRVRAVIETEKPAHTRLDEVIIRYQNDAL
jgi:phage tail-like protein